MPSFSPDNGFNPAPQGPQGPYGNPYQNLFRQAQMREFGSDPASFLSRNGMNYSTGGPSTTFSQGGQQYVNQGSSHEGGGPGGESQFLQGLGYRPSQSMANLGPAHQYGGEIGQMDQAMAATAVQNKNNDVRNLTNADKAAMSASGKDIYGNSAFGTNTGKSAKFSQAPAPASQGPGPSYKPPPKVSPNR